MSFVVVGCRDVQIIGRHDGRAQRLDISYMHLHQFLECLTALENSKKSVPARKRACAFDPR